MKKLFCFFGYHSFNEWKRISNDRYEKRLKRTCKNCGKLEFFDLW